MHLIRAVSATAAAALVFVGTVPGAGAATAERSCSVHGFVGTIRLVQARAGAPITFYYKIGKGTNPGGNKANVNLTFDTEPSTHWYIPDAMIQDDAFHRLATFGPQAVPVGVSFVFDLAHAPDPSCGVWVSTI